MALTALKMGAQLIRHAPKLQKAAKLTSFQKIIRGVKSSSKVIQQKLKTKQNLASIGEKIGDIRNSAIRNKAVLSFRMGNIKLNDKKLKTQIEEVKTYLLKEINNKIESTEISFFNELDDYKEKTTKILNKSQKTVISDSFKKLKIDINNDLEDLTDRIMNSRIL